MKLSSRLTVRYISALTLIAAVLTVTYFNLQQLIKTEENTGYIINVSGRQRMLAQKAALDSLRLAVTQDVERRDSLRVELLYTADLMEQTDLALRDSSTPAAHVDQLRRYTAAVRNWAHTPEGQVAMEHPDLQYILSEASQSFFHNLDTRVLELQKESERKIIVISEFETSMYIVGLLVLMAEALYIFRPAVNAIETERKQLQAVNEELKRLSSLDGLTGIANRRYLDDCLIQEWNRANRDKRELSLIMLDVDCFKLFNDTYGHLAGDDCLRQVASVLKNCAKRPADLPARYGGEEFVLLLPNTNITGATSVAEDVRQAVEQLCIPHKNSTAGNYVTVSLGVASSGNKKMISPQMLVAAADEALYEAKRVGRNRVEVYS